MYKVYPPSKYPCSKRIPLKKCFEEYGEIYRNIPKNNKDGKSEEVILDEGKTFDSDKTQEVLKLCCVFNRDHESRDAPSTSKGQVKKRMKDPTVISEAAKKLHTVRLRIKYQGKLQQKHQDDEGYVCELKPPKGKKANIQPGTEFAVAIRVYYPVSSDSSSKLRFSHEIVVLGSNTLTDVRDKISCRADFGLCTEVENPTDKLPDKPTAKEKYPSGFIFIDDVFYNDMRHENAIDYSEVLCAWAKKANIEPLSTAKMEETKISDLTPMFGYPYVYQHQGDCEHIITFSNAWLLTNSDLLNSTDYPYIKSVQRLRTKKCILCYKSTAKWICYNSDRLPHAEAFLCQQCTLEYNYEDGKKIGDFKLYPYYDESCPV